MKVLKLSLVIAFLCVLGTGGYAINNQASDIPPPIIYINEIAADVPPIIIYSEKGDQVV